MISQYRAWDYIMNGEIVVDVARCVFLAPLFLAKAG
jgi:hypothetical protein